MKDIVIHVLDSVCESNNRDPEATALIEAAKNFGSVESLDQALATERMKFQTEIANMKSRHEQEVKDLRARVISIEEKAVTPAELELLRAIRKKSEAEAVEFKTEIKRRDEQLSAIVAECEARKQQIKTLYGL